MDYSIIIPCYKSDQTIGKVIGLLQEEFKNKEFEIVLVNDGSPDGGKTAQAIYRLVKQYDNVTGIDLAKNIGQHNAILCALNYVEGDYIICMDDDMQTHPNQIYKLIEKIAEGYDMVYAYYPEKKHKWYRNLGSRFSSWTVRMLIGKPKWLKTSSFWIARRFVRDAVIQYHNANAFIPGLILRTTNNIGNVEVEHFDREVGVSGYTLKNLIKLWSNIIGFSVKPLRIASIVGGIFSVVGIFGAIVVIIRKLLFGVNTAGWSSLFMAICFFSGVILMFMGLIGEYVGRLFLASGNQPQFVIRKMEGRIIK